MDGKLKELLTATNFEIGCLIGVASVLESKLLTKKEGQLILESAKRLENNMRDITVLFIEELTSQSLKD